MFGHRAAVAALILSTSASLSLAADGVPTLNQSGEGDRRSCALETSTPGQKTLSDKLDDCAGVLRPAVGVDPQIHVPAPDPHPGDMPVVRPDPDVKAE